jgi:hypothetical protein
MVKSEPWIKEKPQRILLGMLVVGGVGVRLKTAYFI